MSLALTSLGRTTHQIVKIENDGAGNPVYVAWAEPGTPDDAAAHLIAKCLYSGGFIVRFLFANGTLDYNQVYDDRASLTYS